MTEQVQQTSQKKARIITLPEAREILSKIDPDLADQIQKRTQDYLAKFSKIEPDRARKMKKALIEECGLTAEESAELVNICPTTQEELRVFSSGWRKLIPAATVEKIIKILTEG
jgi:DNA-directed RNA polymerase subunit F